MLQMKASCISSVLADGRWLGSRSKHLRTTSWRHGGSWCGISGGFSTLPICSQWQNSALHQSVGNSKQTVLHNENGLPPPKTIFFKRINRRNLRSHPRQAQRHAEFPIWHKISSLAQDHRSVPSSLAYYCSTLCDQFIIGHTTSLRYVYPSFLR